MCSVSGGSRGGAKEAMPSPRPRPVKNSHKKMVTEHGGLYFMFRAPSPPHLFEVSGSSIECTHFLALLNIVYTLKNKNSGIQTYYLT